MLEDITITKNNARGREQIIPKTNEREPARQIIPERFTSRTKPVYGSIMPPEYNSITEPKYQEP